MLNFEKNLVKRKKIGNLRQLQLPASHMPIDFSSNDYLGLARSTQLAVAVLKEVEKYSGPLNGHGSTGSRLLTGNSLYAHELEDAIARFHGFEAGLLFGCGYMANVGLISAVAGNGDTIIYDAGVHASMMDGMRLSRAQAYPFRHNDLDHLEHRLKNLPREGDLFICVESLYSTDGSKAPLGEICRLAKQYEGHVIVDEAHAVGVQGVSGKGLVAEYDLTADVFAQIVTFGKALGTHGAIVLGVRI